MKSLGIKIIVLAISLMALFPVGAGAAAPTMSVTESGTGIDHTVTVESAGQFRLVFEAAMNYGLSKWYDLVNDPAASLDIAQNPTNYLPQHEQGALFNQTMSPGDLIGHIVAAKKCQPDLYRSLTIVENTPVRSVIEVSYHPMIGTANNILILFNDRYHVYPDGKIYITHKMHSDIDQSLTDWRNFVIGLGDPSFNPVNDSGTNGAYDSVTNTITDMSKSWLTNQLAGYMVNSYGSKWIISGNSTNVLQLGTWLGGAISPVSGTYTIGSTQDKYGWVRATDFMNPYNYSSNVAKYIFEYWDPTTPAPNTHWTKASIMLVPKANNPYQGKQLRHEWQGFKRWFYDAGAVKLAAGQDIIQYYMLQLGADNSSILPNIICSAVADPYANDYLNPGTLLVTTGTFTGYDATEGTYLITANNNQTLFQINGTNYKRIKPAFKITGYNSKKAPQITMDGQPKQIGTDFTAALLNSSTLLVQLQSDIGTNATISLSEGAVDLPPPDAQAPSVPTNLAFSNVTPSSVTLSWSASTDNISVAGYRIYRDGSQIASQTGTTSSDTGLLAGTTYAYTVAAFDGAGNVSSQSSALSITTKSIVPPVPPVQVQRRGYGILSYTTENLGVLNWIKERFSYKIGGFNPNSSDVKWMTYFDIYGPGSTAELLLMKDWATTNGMKYEDMLLHAKTDYTSATNPAWSKMDKFDNFEGANGVLMTSNDVNYTDLTSTAYSGNVTWQNTMYLGYEEPFDQVNLTFSVLGAGITRVWEYWNGSTWASLTVSDGTNGFTGNGQVSFTPPASWARKQINSSRNKYFIRCRITAASTNPVTSSVKGDNWLRGSGNLCRGWDVTSGSIVNSGDLAYNPTPPAGAAAKFRYQARIPYWASNHFVANPADFQSAVRTWAKYAAYRINNMVTASGCSGVMGDDGERNLTSEGISSASTDFADTTANTWLTEGTNKYADIVTYAKQLNSAVEVGINAQSKSIVKKGNWNLAEYHTFNWKTASPRNIALTDNATYMNYDDYLPANNPTGVTGVMIYQDTADVVPGSNATWDRGNRGPIVALSKHYTGMNDNTMFSYYTRGGFVYSETDEVILKDGSIKHQATDPLPSVDQVQRWGTYFPAMGVDIGVPDLAGYNAGARDFLWKKGVDIGGGSDVWRRDFTNAIILHRPASYSTSAAQYDTCSTPMSLGATYYPLKADGTTDPAVTSIALRTGEGAILMKYPLSASQPPISDTAAPDAFITSPASGSTASGTTAVTVAASDNVGVSKVEFYENGALRAAVDTAPYSYNWNTAMSANGSYALTAKAYDAAGNVGQSAAVAVTVSNAAPLSVSIINPANGSTVSGATTVSVAVKGDKAIAKVQLYIDNKLYATKKPTIFTRSATFKFRWRSGTFPNGTHDLTAKAYDRAGKTAWSSVVTTTVANPTEH